MKIMFITQWFDPEPTFKGLLFAKKLVDEGHDVEVITGFPNYPGGKVYDGFKIKALSREEIDGVNISRVALYPSHDHSAIKRILNYISFFISSLFFGLFKAQKADVIYSYHPPLTTSLSSILIGKVRRIPVVLDIQDLWPDTLAATGMINNKRLLGFISNVCSYTYKHAKEIVVLSPGFKKRLISRGVPENKISVIYNWCDETALNQGGESKHRLPENGFNLVFAGNMGKAQGIPSILSAAKLLLQKNENVNFVFVGDGVSLNESKIYTKEQSLTNVYFIPRVPMNEVGSILKQADSLLVHLNENELFSITIPSRTQAYMAIGKPIVMGVSGDASQLIEDSDSGLVCIPDDPESIAESVLKLSKLSKLELELKGRCAQNFYDTHLSVSVGVNKFNRIFKRALLND